ncbi:MAG TPA: hypothetical protein VFT02_09545 [Pyrinomonadaceae bacterium]|nr:hypothetical protein [Pyrinomonadaceae bacterium]
MRSSQRHLITPAGIFVSLLLIAPTVSLAQKRSSSAPGGTTSRRDMILMREADLQNREVTLRILREGKARSPQLSANDRKLMVSQIFEDFERLQVVNREMMLASATLNPTSCKQISKLAEEMNKRAKRLKTNLGVPDLEGEKKESEKTPDMDEAQFKASLQTLNASVKSFVGNPLFQDPRVTDVRHLAKLRLDIYNVIDLSRTIKRAASKLG